MSGILRFSIVFNRDASRYTPWTCSAAMRILHIDLGTASCEGGFVGCETSPSAKR